MSDSYTPPRAGWGFPASDRTASSIYPDEDEQTTTQNQEAPLSQTNLRNAFAAHYGSPTPSNNARDCPLGRPGEEFASAHTSPVSPTTTNSYSSDSDAAERGELPAANKRDTYWPAEDTSAPAATAPRAQYPEKSEPPSALSEKTRQVVKIIGKFLIGALIVMSIVAIVLGSWGAVETSQNETLRAEKKALQAAHAGAAMVTLTMSATGSATASASPTAAPTPAGATTAFVQDCMALQESLCSGTTAVNTNPAAWTARMTGCAPMLGLAVCGTLVSYDGTACPNMQNFCAVAAMGNFWDAVPPKTGT